jgi:hypothetical protein
MLSKRQGPAEAIAALQATFLYLYAPVLVISPPPCSPTLFEDRCRPLQTNQRRIGRLRALQVK